MAQTQHKMKITEQQLQTRFNQADLNQNGQLSSDEITKLLQNLGYDDIYKGTIKKICRKINKSKGNNQQDNQAAINFQQFKSYFKVIESPSDRFIFMKQLDRKSSVQEMTKKMNDKYLFPRDKGQKIKLNLLVGQRFPNYPSIIDISLFKHLNNKQQKHKDSHSKCFLRILINCESQQNAKQLAQILKPLWEMIKQLAGGEDQQIAALIQIIQVSIRSQSKDVVILATTKDQYLETFLKDSTQYLDEILKTQVTFLFKLRYGFEFEFQNLQKDKTSRIQQILTRNCELKFKYEGSQFMNSVKELILQFGGFQVLYNVDQYDKESLIYLAMLSTQHVDLNLKFKNVQKRKTWPIDLTGFFVGSIQQMNQLFQQSEQINLKRMCQLIGNSIKIQSCVKNVKANILINMKNIGKIFSMNPNLQMSQQNQNGSKNQNKDSEDQNE